MYLHKQSMVAAALVRKYHARPSSEVITSASSLFLSSLGGGVAGSGCQRRDCSQQKRSRDPRVVLNVSANASRDEIKASFRSLAKRYHPDLRMHLLPHDDDDDTATAANDDDNNSNVNADEIMTELITAYETLMQNKHGYNLSIVDARDSRVALACETYSLRELRGMHRTFDIYTFRIDFSCCSNDDDDDDDDDNDYAMKTYNNESIMNKSTTCSTLDPYPIFPLNVHPDDSISDLKRYIQARYGEEWGLSIGGQRVDRDGLYLGWELVHYNNRNNSKGEYSNVDDDNDGYRSGNDKDYGKVLSYHLFLSSYNIKEGDHVHAIVRRRDV